MFVVEADKAQKREVAIGRRKAGRVEIVSRLKAGERVIVKGTQKVRGGGPVYNVNEAGAQVAAS